MSNPQETAWYESLGIGVQEPKPYVKPIEPAIENDPAYFDLWAGEELSTIDKITLSESFDLVTNA